MLVRNRRRAMQVAVGVLASGAILLAGCVSDKGTAPKHGNVTVRAVNVSPDAGNVDIMINQTLAVGAAPFLADTALSVASGTYTVGFDSAGTALALLSAPVVLSAGSTYDLIMAGAATGSSPNVQLLGGINPPPAIDLTTLAAVRIFNAFADTGSVFGGDTVSIFFTDATDKIGNAKLVYASMPQFASAAVDGNGSPIYVSVDPGTYHVIVTSHSDTTKIAADAVVTLAAGQVRTVIAASSPNRAAGTVVVVPDAN
jgi:hypothetical protein